jgi:hypothetical protein
MIQSWREAENPPSFENGTSAWRRSETVWLRVSDTYEDGNLIKSAYSALGRCVEDRKPTFHPVNPNKQVPNPAMYIVWEDSGFHYEVQGKPVVATHWSPCFPPPPPIV